MEKVYDNFNTSKITGRELSNTSTNIFGDEMLKIFFNFRKLHLESIYHECLYHQRFCRARTLKLFDQKCFETLYNTLYCSMETISEVCHSKEELVLPKKQGKTREIYMSVACVGFCAVMVNNKLNYILSSCFLWNFIVLRMNLRDYLCDKKTKFLMAKLHWSYANLSHVRSEMSYCVFTSPSGEW
jgi:hypothetical protein